MFKVKKAPERRQCFETFFIPKINVSYFCPFSFLFFFFRLGKWSKKIKENLHYKNNADLKFAIPDKIYLLKANNRYTRKRCEKRSKLTRKNQNDIIVVVLVFLLLTSKYFTRFSSTSFVDIEQVHVCWYKARMCIKVLTPSPFLVKPPPQPLNLQTAQAPPFLGNLPLYIGLSWTPL